MTRRMALGLAAFLLLSLLTPFAGTVAAAGTTLYVDGKNGNDGNDGQSMAKAFKTIDAAARAIPAGSAPGWKVVVRGYDDYVYRERPIWQGWRSWGAEGNPIVFQAEGWAPGASNYVRPIVDGSDVAPRQGKTWQAGPTEGIWWTDWADKPAQWAATGYFGETSTAVFQDFNKWLWSRGSLSALGSSAAAGHGGYYWDESQRRLYVAPLGGTPFGHRFEVVMRNTFFFKGEHSARDIAVRGFRVFHSDNGIAFVNGADRGEIVDNVIEANLFMGVHTKGRQTANGPDPAAGHTILRNAVRYNSVQAIKIGFGTENTVVCNNRAERNAIQGVKIQGTHPDGSYKSTSSGIVLCQNFIGNQVYRPPERKYDNATGLTLANGARNVAVRGNTFSNNGIGIHIVQEGSRPPAFAAITIEWNRIAGNRRFGMNIFDGIYGNGQGDVLARHNLYWANAIGVMVDRGTSNKTLRNETIYANKSNGVVVNGRGVGTELTISSSLLTHNRQYGALVSKAGRLTISHSGLAANGSGPTRNANGKLLASALNTKAPGYLSRSAGSVDFLKISTASYQYTAGPGGTPIGARY